MSVSRAAGSSSRSPAASHSNEADNPCIPAGPLPPGLYLVATPIGNLADLGHRARSVLAKASVIACEDSRVTARLLQRYGIRTPMQPCHEHNERRVAPQLIRRLQNGEIVALVSDAGTPLVSDPGFRLVGAALEAGLPVTAVPGPSAVLAALTLSGLPPLPFLFAGFPPAKAAARRAFIERLAPLPATLVLLEAPGRLPACLADLAALLGERPAAVARELTKRFEEVRRGPLPELARQFAESGPPKGEIVLVIGPPADGTGAAVEDRAVDAALAAALHRLGVRDAAEIVALASGRPRRAVYQRALALRRGGGAGA